MPIDNGKGESIRSSKKTRCRHLCPVHKAILNECAEQLASVGYFNKEEILSRNNLTEMADAVRWDFLIEFLSDPEDDWGLELVPLAQRFFKTPKKERDRTEFDSLSRYLAVGHGKKTAGYASVKLDNGRLAVRLAAHKAALRNGTAEAWKRYAERVVDQAELPEPMEEKITQQGQRKLARIA